MSLATSHIQVYHDWYLYLYFIYTGGRISDYTFACYQIAFCVIRQFSVNLQYKVVNSLGRSGDYYKIP